MRQTADLKRIEELLRFLGGHCAVSVDVYLTGGATAVIEGWRTTTVDVDMKPIPDRDEFLRELPIAKERLKINIELASPADFIPELPGWRERSRFIVQHGNLRFHHYDPYSQALSKIERGHSQDLKDVASAIKAKLVNPQKLLAYFERIEPELYKYPAIDPATFREAVLAVTRKFAGPNKRNRRMHGR